MREIGRRRREEGEKEEEQEKGRKRKQEGKDSCLWHSLFDISLPCFSNIFINNVMV